MVPRGEVGLIFVATGTTLTLAGQPLLTPHVQAGIIGALLLTTMIGPVGLGWVLKGKSQLTKLGGTGKKEGDTSANLK